MWYGAYFVGIDRDGYHRELAAQYLPLIGRIQGEQVLAILKRHREDGVVGLAGARLVAFKCPRLARHHCPAEPVTLIRDHPLRKQVDCIVLIQQRRKTPFLRREHAVGGHRELIGVDCVKGLAGSQATHKRPHLLDLIPYDHDGQSAEQPLACGFQVAPGGAPHRDRVDSMADAPQVLDRSGAVIAANEGHEGDLMSFGQMAEHVVRSDLGTGVKGVGQDLCEEKDPCHRTSLTLEP